jgi:hypothetical protein
MKWTVRFLLPFILALSALAYGLIPLVDFLTRSWFIRDLDLRSQAGRMLLDATRILRRRRRGRRLPVSRPLEGQTVALASSSANKKNSAWFSPGGLIRI